MPVEELIVAFGASMIIGALIGLEREKSKQTLKNLSPIGIRTSILISLFGALSAYLGQTYDPAIFLISLGAMVILIVSSHISLVARYDRIGVTTEITSILLFLYGAMCMVGQSQTAVILGILTTLILSLREYLHGIIENINHRELSDTIKFAIIAFIILPFLPNRSYDDQIIGFLMPNGGLHGSFGGLDVLNPYRIWFLVVLASGVSFLGYILVKVLGKKVGISISGLLGGLYSSTATSLTLASRSKEMPKTVMPFVAGITLACALSFIKMFIFIGALNSELLNHVVIPMGAMFIYLLAVGLYLMLKQQKTEVKNKDTFETPFTLWRGLKLGALIVGALLIAKFSLAYAGVNLYYIVSIGLSVFAIDDPIIISTSAAAGTAINWGDARNIILLVILLNTAQKAGIAYYFGNKKLTKPLALIFAGLGAVTLVTLFL